MNELLGRFVVGLFIFYRMLITDVVWYKMYNI